jgi:hypothetical protein
MRALTGEVVGLLRYLSRRVWMTDGGAEGTTRHERYKTIARGGYVRF